MTEITEIKPGDILWQGHGLLGGRDHDDTATGYYATEAEALAAVESEWLAWLTPSERERADTYARRYRIEAVEPDGTVGSAITID